MGSSRDKGWYTKPKLDEARVIAPDVPTTRRARKDRRRWCKGKVGIEHMPEMRVGKSGQYMRDRYGPSNPHAACGWYEGHAWSWVDGVRHWLGQGEFFWSCKHDYVCANCGKILRRVGRECPEFRPHEHDWKS